MPHIQNKFGQKIGMPLPNWTPPPFPDSTPMEGRFCRLEILDPKLHAQDLFKALCLETEESSWTYLFYGPFSDFESFLEWMTSLCFSQDPQTFAIISKETNKIVGIASYLRIFPKAGCIEVGHVHFSKSLKKSPAATEAMYLMMKRAFELGYRRYEWKCDALNAPSRAAAQRLGLSLEGVFRNAIVTKGRNRDTAWYAAIDSDWPELLQAFTTWLAPNNFDENGKQRKRLIELTSPISARKF